MFKKDNRQFTDIVADAIKEISSDISKKVVEEPWFGRETSGLKIDNSAGEIDHDKAAALQQEKSAPEPQDKAEFQKQGDPLGRTAAHADSPAPGSYEEYCMRESGYNPADSHAPEQELEQDIER